MTHALSRVSSADPQSRSAGDLESLIEADRQGSDEDIEDGGQRERSWWDKLFKKTDNDPLMEEMGSADPLHRRFHLPDSELLIEDYACALHSTILLQGRMYIFPRHVCFACDLIGNVKSLCIAFKDVTDIRKAKTAFIIPNAIEITTAHEKYLFASFLFRREAYQGLSNFWAIAKGIQDFQNTNDGEMQEDEDGGNADEVSMMPRSMSVPGDLAAAGQSDSIMDLPTQLLPTSASASDVLQDVSTPAASKMEPTDTILTSLNRSDHGKPSTFNDLAESLDPKQYPNLCLDESLSCEVVQFYRHFFAQFSGFSEHYNKARKNTELKESDWNALKGANNSFAREVQYTSPINTPLPSFVAKKTTRVREVQSCRLVKEHSFVLETSMVMLDIPYGDSFEVNARWDVLANGDAVSLKIHADVKFKKSTMFASKIRKDTIVELKSAYAKWFSLAEDVLAGRLVVTPKQPTSWQAVQRAHHQASLRNLAAGAALKASASPTAAGGIDLSKVSPGQDGAGSPAGRPMPTISVPNSPFVQPAGSRRLSSMSSLRPETIQEGGWFQGAFTMNAAKIAGWLLLAYVLISVGQNFLGVNSTLKQMQELAGACSALVKSRTSQRGGGGKQLPSADYFLEMKLQLWESTVALALEGSDSGDAGCPAGELLARHAAHADAQAEIMQREIDAVEARLLSLRRQRDWHRDQVQAVQAQLKKLPACKEL